MSLKQKLIVFAMMIGIFLCMLDTTVMNIALPAIQTDLNVNLNTLSWALNVYTITFAVFTIPFGRIADIFGRHKLYLAGLFGFIIGSGISGLATNAGLLISGRAIQSLGAAIIFPASMTIGISATTVTKRTGVLAALGITQGLASAFGPTIGGIVTQYLGWRFVFLINLPLTLIVIGLCFSLLPLRHESRLNAKIDWWGMGLSMSTLFSLTLALVKGNDWGWSSLTTIGLFALSACSLVGFIIAERFNTDPMVPLSLFKDRQFTGASLATILTTIFLVAVLVILPTFFTKILGHSELTAALMITPTSLMIFFASPIGGFLTEKIGPRLLISFGFLQLIAGYVVLSLINPTQYSQTVIALILIGGGFGIIAGPLVVLGASNFTGKLLAASQSVLGVFREVGSLLAVAIFVSMLSANLTTARHQALIQANHQIETAQLSPSVKVHFRMKADQTIASGKAANQEPTTQLSSANTQHLTRAVYQREITRIPHFQKLPQEAKQTIYRWVNHTVTTKIKRQEGLVKATTVKIKQQTKDKMAHAFKKLYQVAMPLTLLAGLSSFLFERKRDYLK